MNHKKKHEKKVYEEVLVNLSHFLYMAQFLVYIMLKRKKKVTKIYITYTN